MKRNSAIKIIAAFIVAAAFAAPSAQAAGIQNPAGCTTSIGTCSFIASSTGFLEVAGAAGAWSISIDSSVCYNSPAASVLIGFSCTANAGQRVTVTVNGTGGGLVSVQSYTNLPSTPGQ